MMTSLLADKSVIVKIKIMMNFVDEPIKPTCNSLLATYFELNFEAFQKRASSCLKTLVCPKRTLSQLFELLFPPSPFDVAEEKVLGERGKESPLGGPKGPIEIGGVCETEVGTEANVALTRLGSLGTTLSVSRSQKSSVGRDLPRRMCSRCH